MLLIIILARHKTDNTDRKIKTLGKYFSLLLASDEEESL